MRRSRAEQQADALAAAMRPRREPWQEVLARLSEGWCPLREHADGLTVLDVDGWRLAVCHDCAVTVETPTVVVAWSADPTWEAVEVRALHSDGNGSTVYASHAVTFNMLAGVPQRLVPHVLRQARDQARDQAREYLAVYGAT